MVHLGLILILLLSLSVFGQPSPQQTIFETAVIAARNGDHLNALSGFRKALMQAKIEGSSDEFLARIHFNIGVCLFKLDRPADAISEYREAIRLNADYERARYSLGVAEMAENDIAEAEEAFRNVLRLNKGNGEAWFELGSIYVVKRDLENAEIAFRRSIEFRSISSSLGHNNVGVILAMRNDLAAAEKEFEIAIAESKGQLLEAQANLEYCKQRQRDISRATKDVAVKFAYMRNK